MIEDGTVVHEVFYRHPPERVWQALTDPEQLAAWTRSDPGGSADAPFEVVEKDPPRHLCWRCEHGSVQAEVSFDLTSESDGTRLRIQHRGFGPVQ